MRIRRTIAIAFGLLLAVKTLAVSAGVDNLSNDEAGTGIRAAIGRGAEIAVSQLGKPNGFLGDDKVRIGLPESLRRAEKAARTLGFSQQADELTTAMNRAAEAAVAQAKPILINAVKKISIRDAKDILLGAPDAATQYFKRTTSTELAAKFLPIVKRETAKLELAQKYNEFASKAAKFRLIDEEDSNLDAYVTRKSMDGLFLIIAEQERQIRADPIAAGSSCCRRPKTDHLNG